MTHEGSLRNASCIYFEYLWADSSRWPESSSVLVARHLAWSVMTGIGMSGKWRVYNTYWCYTTSANAWHIHDTNTTVHNEGNSSPKVEHTTPSCSFFKMDRATDPRIERPIHGSSDWLTDWPFLCFCWWFVFRLILTRWWIFVSRDLLCWTSISLWTFHMTWLFRATANESNLHLTQAKTLRAWVYELHCITTIHLVQRLGMLRVTWITQILAWTCLPAVQLQSMAFNTSLVS